MRVLASLEGLSSADRATLLDRLETLEPDRATALLHALRTETLQRCETDGWFWVTRFVRTRDEADTESIKPFPDKPYLEAIWREIDASQRVVIAKSRQLMISWVLCAYAVWFARFHAHKTVLWQTQKEPDAFQMVCLAGAAKDGGVTARCQFIERHLPEWMRLPVKESAGILGYPNGSVIQGIPGGKDQVRSRVASLIIEDEFAFQEEAAGVYQAVAPLIQKATKFIAVSTPNGPTGMFAELYHGVKQDVVTA